MKLANVYGCVPPVANDDAGIVCPAFTFNGPDAHARVDVVTPEHMIDTGQGFGSPCTASVSIASVQLPVHDTRTRSV